MSNSNLVVPQNQCLGKTLGMDHDEQAKIIGQNVAQAREKAGFSQAELAEKIGARSQNTIASIEGGKTRKSKFMPDIARVLKVRLVDLDPFVPEEVTQIVKAQELPAGEPVFPIYGLVEGGEGAIVLTNEPIEMIRSPSALAHVRDAYGVIVAGDSMIPAARPGDVVYINPHIPPRPSDLCLFIHNTHGEFRATLKEYCGQTATVWEVRRYQPTQKRIALSKKEWPRCDVVVMVDRKP